MMSTSATKRSPVATLGKLSIACLLIGLLTMLFLSSTAGAVQPTVGLGTAEDFAVLAGSTITNTGTTRITGDVGLSPGDSVTGFESVILNGELHVADAVAEQAKIDLRLAYNDAAGRGPATNVSTELGGQTLQAGVYASESGTFEITGTVTLDAASDPDAVFIFQMESTLITATGSNVLLINGADACNVFWQVGSSATLGGADVGAVSSFKGTILALESISLNTGAQVQGRLLARTGAVTMSSNVITNSGCSASQTPSPSPTPTGPSPDPTSTGPSPDPTSTGPSPDPTSTGPSPDPTSTGPSPDPTSTGPSPDPTSTEPTPGPTSTGPSPTPSATSTEQTPSPAPTDLSPTPTATGGQTSTATSTSTETVLGRRLVSTGQGAVIWAVLGLAFAVLGLGLRTIVGTRRP